MFDKLKGLLAGLDADYADARYEVKTATSLAFAGRELTTVGSNATDGFVVRVLAGGGMASVVFTKEADGRKAAATALANARLIGRAVKKPVALAPAEAVKDSFKPALKEDPRAVSIEEKLDLLRRYNDIPLAHEGVATTALGYGETVREKWFVSTEGGEIREELVTTRVLGEIIAKDGGLTQNVRVACGGSQGFQHVRGQEALIEERTRIALDLLKARPVQGGSHDCVLNCNLAGVFAHEAFGHFSEADIVETLPAMREKMRLGARLGSESLSITDDATRPDLLGFYRYDDEGVRVRKTKLLDRGVLVGRLHSRRTAAEFGEPLSGHMIAEDYRFAPIVRMGTIFIEPGEHSVSDLLERLGEGLYICDAKGGQTAGENFSFGAQYAYEVKGGKQGRMLRDINISGDLYRTMTDIAAVGKDVGFAKSGGCGKGQTNIRSCHGAPHVLIKNLVVGGAR
ncbi:MAG: TldD/PmbA family protein [Elusimicrobia bacterium]|nr:TldD/PmbA family protein [Elusimicrobiota bacterium]